jgi:putative transcriptional regulator
MSYTSIPINRDNLTILDVPFPDRATLDSAANAIGSNMFEGFVPTAKNIRVIRDYLTDKITLQQFMQLAKDKAYE